MGDCLSFQTMDLSCDYGFISCISSIPIACELASHIDYEVVVSLSTTTKRVVDCIFPFVVYHKEPASEHWVTLVRIDHSMRGPLKIEQILTKSILSGRKNKLPDRKELEIRRGDIKIKQHTSVTYLGCILDENLSGESMATRILGKINGRPREGVDRVVVPWYQRGYNIVQMWWNLVPKVGVPVPSLYESVPIKINKATTPCSFL